MRIFFAIEWSMIMINKEKKLCWNDKNFMLFLTIKNTVFKIIYLQTLSLLSAENSVRDGKNILIFLRKIWKIYFYQNRLF